MLKAARAVLSRAGPRGDPSLFPRARGDPYGANLSQVLGPLGGISRRIRGQPPDLGRRLRAAPGRGSGLPRGRRQGKSLSFGRLAGFLLALFVSSPGLGADITNTVYVDYVNEAGINPQLVTSSTSFTITTDSLPAAPSGLTAAGRDGGIGLSWQVAVPGTFALSGYLVYRATYSGLAAVNANLLAGLPGAGTTLYFDPAVVARAGYCYLVQAVDVTGLRSPPSNEACAVAPVIPPFPPADFSAALSGQAIQLSWTPAVAGSDPISGYLVFRATYAPFLPGTGTLLGAVPGPAAAGFLDNSAAPATLYFYVVRAVSIYGLESPDSALVSAKSLPEQDEAGIRLTVQIFDASGRLVRELLDALVPAPLDVVSVADGSSRAQLERGGSLRIVLSDGTVVSWDGRDDKGRPAPNGFYSVRTANLLPDGRERVASVSFTFARQYERLIKSALLAPNPARDTVWIGYSLAATFGEVNVKIYAVSGELVYRGSAPGHARAFNWNLRNDSGSRVAAGLYIVVLEAWDPWTQKHDREVMKLAVEAR